VHKHDAGRAQQKKIFWKKVHESVPWKRILPKTRTGEVGVCVGYTTYGDTIYEEGTQHTEYSRQGSTSNTHFSTIAGTYTTDHSALTLAAAEGGDISLLVLRYHVDHQISSGQSALMLAAYMGHVDVVQVLLNRAANLELRDASGHTALMFAVGRGHTASVALLLKAGADGTAIDLVGKGIADWAQCMNRTIYQMLETAATAVQYPVDAGSPMKDPRFIRFCRESVGQNTHHQQDEPPLLHDLDLRYRKCSICQKLGCAPPPHLDSGHAAHYPPAR
jgi:hypothetical protein